MKILRTPESYFDHLPDYPFTPNYQMVGDELRMHYVDEGTGPVVLLLHGEPSWSFLYRKMIPVFVENGFRVIAPDLIGFGKSDKPADRGDYTYARHLKWLSKLIEQLDLKNMHLFCQDWGGLLGLRIVANHPDWFATVTASNTALPTGKTSPNEMFMQWREFSQSVPEFSASRVINMGTTSDLSPETLAAYDAPFPDERYKEGARIFPMLVPISEEDPEAAHNHAAWKVLTQWNKPFLTLFSDKDFIMKGLEKVFQKNIPGTANQAHTIIEQAGHFLQEDKGEEIAGHCIRFIQSHL